MLKLFSELLKTSRSIENEEAVGMTAETWQEFCNESSRVLEPMVRSLISKVKGGAGAPSLSRGSSNEYRSPPTEGINESIPSVQILNERRL